MSRKQKKTTTEEFEGADSTDDLIKNTIEEEKTDVFKVCARISRRLGVLLLITGVLSIITSGPYILLAQWLFTAELKILFLALIGFIGVVNLLCGFLLLAKE